MTRLARAALTTAAVHAALVALSAAYGVGLLGTLAAASGRTRLDLRQLDALLPALERAGAELGTGALLGAGLAWLLATPLFAFWAEGTRLGPGAGARRALRRSPAALAVSLVLALPAGAALAVMLGAGLVAHAALAGPDARAQDLGALAAGGLAAMPALVVAGWHDLARARAVAGVPLVPALRGAAADALRLAPAAALAKGLRLVLAGSVLAPPGVQQLGLALRSALRGAWLALVAARTERALG
ncbi:MAG: hypothetical protein AAF447_16520 [Myxococcota bacterium]